MKTVYLDFHISENLFKVFKLFNQKTSTRIFITVILLNSYGYFAILKDRLKIMKETESH